jgi:dynein heavy chain
MYLLGTEEVLRSDKPVEIMYLWAEEYKAELQKLIKLIRGHYGLICAMTCCDIFDFISGDLKKIERKIIVALVTTDVHARDIIDELYERQVASVNDFLWQQQLRYYWDADVDDCLIRHSDAKVRGFKYVAVIDDNSFTHLFIRLNMVMSIWEQPVDS